MTSHAENGFQKYAKIRNLLKGKMKNNVTTYNDMIQTDEQN